MKGSVPMLFDCNATHSQPVFFSICACKWDQLPYSGKLSQEKTFADCSLLPPKDTMPQNFAEKTFMNGLKTLILIRKSFLTRKFLVIRYYTIHNNLLTHSINGYKWQHYTIPLYTHTHSLVVAEVCQKDGESGVNELPNHEHGFAMFETKDTKHAEEKAFLCSFHNPLVAGGILSLFHPLLSPHLHLKIDGACSIICCISLVPRPPPFLFFGLRSV